MAGTEQEHSLSSGRVFSTVERGHQISGWLAVTDSPGFAPALIFLRNQISSAVQTLRKSRMRLYSEMTDVVRTPAKKSHTHLTDAAVHVRIRCIMATPK